MTNSLESVVFIKIPETFKFTAKDFSFDSSVELPVQKKTGEEQFNPEELTEEQILAGILAVLAYDKKNKNLDYYRNLIVKVRPNIKTELCEAAILKTKNEDFELAEEIFMSLLGLDPEDSAVILNMALFLDQRAESYRRAGLNEDADAYDSDALQYYKAAMDSENVLPDTFFNAGFFFMKQHKFKDAKDCFETYVALTCDVSDEELGENGIYKKERAQQIINEIKNQNMDDDKFHHAYELIMSDQNEKALNELYVFIKDNPKVWNAWFMLGWALRKSGRFSDAKQAFLKSLEYGGDSNSDVYNELSLCYIQEKDFDEAKTNLLKAYELSPESTKVISNLGYLALAQGDKENARKYFTTVLEFDPKDKIAASELFKLEKED